MARKQTTEVKLRSRQASSGKTSLYISYYSQGERCYESLKLFLIPEHTKADKEANAQTMALAKALVAQKTLELHNQRLGIDTSPKFDVRFFDYFQGIIDKKEGTTKQSWKNCLAHLKLYEKRHDITFDSITPKWIEGFKQYLITKARQWDIDPRKRIHEKKPLSDGSKALMFQKLCATINQAVKDGIITTNPTKNIERFKEPESEREYLTIDEVRLLAASECAYPRLKDAFLFSCLTGLRWSDIISIKWGQIELMNGVTRLHFRQTKTRSIEYLDLSPQAVPFMGSPGNSADYIFGRFLAPPMARLALTAWIKAAGITKHITFHCARHTFAVMMLSLGTDIYTLSKLLGHRSLESTQVYARILDQSKQAAVCRIPDIFSK